MDEERLLQMLKDSAEQIRIPVSLQPEQAAERLLEAKRKRQREWLKKIRTYAAMAAGVVVLIGAVAAAGRYGLFSGSMSGAQKESTAAACGGDDAGQDGGSMVSETAEDAKNEEREAGTPTSADSLYRPAEDYGDVYDNVDRAWKNQEICLEGGQKSVDKSESTDTATIASTSSEGAVGYSATNTQNENVDEGDFVKTDGDFLYVASGSDIYIVDIRDGVMQKPARLSLESLAGETKNGNSIHEIYVEGGLLQVVCGNREEVVYIYEPDEKVYRMKEKSQVKVFTLRSLLSRFRKAGTPISRKILWTDGCRASTARFRILQISICRKTVGIRR